MKDIWIECFKAGDQTDSAGNSKTWTYDDLVNIAKIYNEKIAEGGESYEAPVVYGHPETDSPAQGWVTELKVEGNTLKAHLDRLNTQFVESVKSEEYKKVSIALYDDMMLRHIGFLGAVPPAVKGLEPVKFAENPNFSEYEGDLNVKQAEGTKLNFAIQLRDDLKRDKPKEYSDYTDGDFADPIHFRFPLKTRSQTVAAMALFSKASVYNQYEEHEQQYIAGRLMLAAGTHNITPTPKTWKYAEVAIPVPISSLSRKQLENHVINNANANNNIPPITEGKFAMDENLQKFVADLVKFISEISSEEIAVQLQTKADEIATTYFPAKPEGEQAPTPPPVMSEPDEKDLRIAELEKFNREMKNEKYFTELLDAGKVTPNQKQIVTEVLEMFHSKGVQFAEGSNPADKIHKLIESFPKHNLFSETAPKQQAATGRNQFTAPEGFDIDPDREALLAKINEHIAEQKKSGRTISFAEALQEINN